MKYFFVMHQVVPVAAGVELATVLAALGRLVSRYESLHSRYWTSEDGRGLQQVRGDGELAVRVWEGPEGEEFDEQFTTECRDLAGVPFAHERELPIRVLVGMRSGMPVAVYLGVSHVAVDAHGIRLLGGELTRLIDAAHKCEPEPEAPAARQPREQATIEQSAPGQALNRAAIAYYRKQLGRVPDDVFPDRVPADGPRYLGAELRSTAIPRSRSLCGRRRAPPCFRSRRCSPTGWSRRCATPS
jgi:hypothetical protein